MKCRSCNSGNLVQFVDLGSSAISNRFLVREELSKEEKKWPLCVFVCADCKLVQLEEFESRQEIFNKDYAYFSSFSSTWLDHASEFVDYSIDKLGINTKSFVIEIASNDGYLLKNYVNKQIPCLGVEPCANVASAARRLNINTVELFFGFETAKEILETYGTADLIIANNVLAHVPDLHDFVAGFKLLLADDGVVSFEFPHVLELITNNQFDTIYHEHYSYLSLTALRPLFEKHGLEMTDVRPIPTHGGSLRLFVTHQNKRTSHRRVNDLLALEKKANLTNIEGYMGFQPKVEAIKKHLLELLSTSKQSCNQIVGYGAAAKGNTLLQYCNIDTDLITWIADASPRKQGCFTPGTHIPIVSTDRFAIDLPDEVLILPWNISDEIISFLQGLKMKKLNKAYVSIPTPRVIAL